jgi:hypothetical protein
MGVAQLRRPVTAAKQSGNGQSDKDNSEHPLELHKLQASGNEKRNTIKYGEDDGPADPTRRDRASAG